MKMAIMFLPCADDSEAEKIGEALLDKKLIVCAKRTPVSSSFFWQGKTESDKEVLLILESIEENFEKIEEVVREIHSYKTFVLTSLPVTKYSTGVEKWLEEGLSSE